MVAYYGDSFFNYLMYTGWGRTDGTTGRGVILRVKISKEKEKKGIRFSPSRPGFRENWVRIIGLVLQRNGSVRGKQCKSSAAKRKEIIQAFDRLKRQNNAVSIHDPLIRRSRICIRLWANFQTRFSLVNEMSNLFFPFNAISYKVTMHDINFKYVKIFARVFSNFKTILLIIPCTYSLTFIYVSQ